MKLFNSYFLVLSMIYGVILIILYLILFNNKWYAIFDQFNFLSLKKSFKYLKKIILINRVQILLISMLRYLVFIVQYYVLFIAFKIPLDLFDVAIFWV